MGVDAGCGAAGDALVLGAGGAGGAGDTGAALAASLADLRCAAAVARSAPNARKLLLLLGV